MSDNVKRLPSADTAIRALHAEIEKLSAHASSGYLATAPFKVEDNGIGDKMSFFYDANDIKVFTCEDMVFMSGVDHGGAWPDWFHLPRNEAREVANALMSASAYVAKDDDE